MSDINSMFVKSAQFNEPDSGYDDFEYSSLFDDDEAADFADISEDSGIHMDSAGIDTGHVIDIYGNQKLKVVVVPVRLEKKTVEVFVTQDNVFCKNYMMELLGVLPEYVHHTTDESPWILPRVYPVQNGVLFNQFFENAQQDYINGLTAQVYVEELSIYDIRQRCRDTQYELNYINSQLTLVSQGIDVEFGGSVE